MRIALVRAVKMRVGLIWNRDDPHVKATVRYERYMRGFRALGHDPIMVCNYKGAEGFQDAFVAADSLDRFTDPDWWACLRLDAAVVITYLVFAPVLRALKRSCPHVVSIADSDGKVGVRLFPWATFVHSTLQHSRPTDRLRAAKFWLQRYFAPPEVYHRPVLESSESADVVAVGSVHAKRYLSRFFAYHKRPDLVSKLQVIPYPVDDCFLTGETPRRRANQIVAVGRWDDPQKDAPLLARAVRRLLAVKPDLTFRFVGRGGESIFGPLCRTYSQVRYLGVQSPEAVAELLKESRSLVMSSRWEGAPVVLNEALCQGCSLVGPDDVASLCSFCEDGTFGTLSHGRSADALTAAVLKETAAWDEGRRDSVAIAETWRPQFDPQTVCSQLLEPAASKQRLWETPSA
jgi:glycosyltransferase involved in cell wall biosynthesis